MPLTDLSLRALKPKERAYQVSDGRGLVIEVMPGGAIVYTSWADSSVQIVHGGTHMMQLVKGVSAPADIGVDTKRNILAVPRFNDGKVEYFRLP